METPPKSPGGINRDRLMLLIFSPLICGALAVAAAGIVVRQFPQYFRESWRAFGERR